MTATRLGQTDEDFDLFTHVLDQQTRNHNRANFMANVFEDHTPTDSSVVDKIGAARILRYFTKIPKEEQKEVLQRYKEIMFGRGFKEVECQ